MKKKQFDWAVVWIIICLGWLIFGCICSVKQMDVQANRCLIQAVLFYLFFISDEIRVRLDDIEDKINKKQE